jgi:hypothetical protein
VRVVECSLPAASPRSTTRAACPPCAAAGAKRFARLERVVQHRQEVAMSLQQEFTLVERTEQYKLPHLRLRELGLRNVPAVPVDLGGMLDTLLKLGLRAKQREQAYQALTKT